MGGIGSGGQPGVGRKPKEARAKFVQGSRNRSKAPAELPKVEEFDAPNDLTVDERNVWLSLAPGAFKARTLTRATEAAFKLLCQDVLLERDLRADPEKRGGADHRGMRQQVRAEMKAFGISPVGKPIVTDAPKSDDPFDQFDVTVFGDTEASYAVGKKVQ